MSLVEVPRAPTMSSPTGNTKNTSEITPYKTMRGHTKRVSGVAHLHGGQRIITCSSDGSIRLWDLKNGAQMGDEWRDEGDEAGVWTMALSPNGKTLASGSGHGTVRLWDVETGKVIAKCIGHTGGVESVCWSADGERVVSGGWDETARVWDVKSGELVLGLNPIKTEHEDLWAVSYSPKAAMIATGGHSGIEIWDAKTGELLSTIGDPGWCLAWTSDEKKLISGTWNGSIRIFDTATWQQIAVLDGHQRPVYSITLFPNDRLLASTSWDHTARLWNLDTNLPVGPPLQHEQETDCVAFSADGKLLSTGCADENVYVWDVQAIIKTAGLEYLLSIPNAQNFELKKKSLSGAKATRRPIPRRVPPGFFDGARDHGPSSTERGIHPDPSLHHRRTAFAPSWGSRPRALLARIPSLFRRSQPNDKPTELQQRPGSSTFSRCSPPVVEVPALDDKKALYTARRTKRASDKVKRVKNPAWWARVVLFICCASQSTDDAH